MLAKILKNPFVWVLLAGAAWLWWGWHKAKQAAGAIVDGVKSAADTVVIKPVQGATIALANVLGVNEAGGFSTSDGQADPYVLYNAARQAYATSHGYAAGTDNFRNPPGFPDYTTWQATQSGISSLFSWGK